MIVAGTTRDNQLWIEKVKKKGKMNFRGPDGMQERKELIASPW